MIHMDHVLNLGFPVNRNDFSLQDWEMNKLWNGYLADERDLRQRLTDERNRARRKLRLDPISSDAY